MYQSTKNLTRLLQILRILAKHDAIFFIEDSKAFPVASKFAKLLTPVKSSKNRKLRKGERLANAFIELGTSFVKLGQALSIRSDLIGEEIANDLANLQDNMPAFNSKQAIEIIENELDASIDDLFNNFEEKPVAAASIAQVHFAEDKEGNKLAVKVLRPEIEKKFQKDIDLLLWLSRNIDLKLPKYRRLKLVEIVKTFAETTKTEMDFSFEAAAASELAENFEGDNDIKIPQIYWQKTTSKVLTLERIEGIHIDDIEALEAAKIDTNEVLRKSANIFLKQSLRDGFFHADMHPGNMMIDKSGAICVFDFGIMGRIDRKTQIFLAEMLLGFLNKDYQKVADVHFEAGYIPQDQDRELFAQACRSIGEPIFNLPQNEISIARLLQKLFRITEKFQMETQPQLLLLQKTMMMAEGIGRKLDPNVNFWELSQELIKDWGKDNLGAKSRLEDEVKDALTAAKKIKNAAMNLDNIITEKGILLHPETINALKAKGNSGFLKGAIFASIIAAIVYTISNII